MKEILVVVILSFVMLFLFAGSAVFFIPWLGELPFCFAGVFSNIWLVGTIGICSFVFFGLGKILDRRFLK